jgi:hypothetical protein
MVSAILVAAPTALVPRGGESGSLRRVFRLLQAYVIVVYHSGGQNARRGGKAVEKLRLLLQFPFFLK